MKKLKALLERLCDDSRGTALIETAIVAPTLIVMCIGGFEVATMVEKQSRLQSTAELATEIAMVSAREGGADLRTQPVFCLLRADLLPSLTAFTQAGGRKIDRWTDQHRTVIVPFDQPGDDPKAFFNANTLAELHALEKG